ncbi:hypothetical protein [Mycoplasmopsis verecunda]|uniref:Uncharacterized protein n=1 Tax=Mycoplasmopsis verecunda TaxID=171291 RepID=A0A1T4LVF9_9BACT|nr:hypothetical protein [Mycoplasmopsis verecunda]WPB54520.1 hypothetical protein SAM46_03545 [Mycoplasmopsis verecunda]SJZ58444.1 hypothetical protein SAMN02745154_00545 [Mycoplasmopsis verecunda]
MTNKKIILPQFENIINWLDLLDISKMNINYERILNDTLKTISEQYKRDFNVYKEELLDMLSIPKILNNSDNDKNLSHTEIKLKDFHLTSKQLIMLWFINDLLIREGANSDPNKNNSAFSFIKKIDSSIDTDELYSKYLESKSKLFRIYKELHKDKKGVVWWI